MAQTTTTVMAAAIHTEILGDRILAANVPRAVMLQFVNMYNIAGRTSKNLKLNTYSDIGAATTASEGTTFSTVTTMGLESAVTLTPTEAAVIMANITDDTVENVTGFRSAAQLFQQGSLEQVLSVLSPEAERLFHACIEKAEGDMIAQFANASQSVGTTTVDLSIGTIEEGIYTLVIGEPPRRDFVGVLAPRQISDLRRELAVTSGGVNSSYHDGKSVDLNKGMNGYEFDVLGVPMFGYDESVKLTANAAADVVGGLFLPGSGDPELSGNGVPGAYALCEARSLDFRAQYELRERAIDLMANWKFAVGERRDPWTVQVVSDA